MLSIILHYSRGEKRIGNVARNVCAGGTHISSNISYSFFFSCKPLHSMLFFVHMYDFPRLGATEGNICHGTGSCRGSTAAGYVTATRTRAFGRPGTTCTGRPADPAFIWSQRGDYR